MTTKVQPTRASGISIALCSYFKKPERVQINNLMYLKALEGKKSTQDYTDSLLNSPKLLGEKKVQNFYQTLSMMPVLS